MCGINGFIKATKQEDANKLIQCMNKAIIHRGPDDQGYYHQGIDDNNLTVTVGQIRLSIIDLSDAGFQPMFYDPKTGCFSQKHDPELLETLGSKSIRIVFNGEIYNYQEIKEELEKLGYHFSSHSDTEVILASYLERGNNCVNKFNGMRAFAIYNPNKQELFCSRDRLGKKPFYYYFDGKQYIFSSQLKAILEHKELSINIQENLDNEAIDFYFTLGYIPAPWTIYKNVKKLESRHNLLLQLRDGVLAVSTYCYYTIPTYHPIHNKPLLIQEGKKILEDSVKIRMFTSDVPVGAFLSGGLDSSSVVAEMTKRVDREKLNTFSIGFEGTYDESKYIHIVEQHFGTQHHHEYFKKQDFEEMLPYIYTYYDEPFADYSNFPTMFVSKLARKYVTVCLSGDGGDEIFGGYTMHQVAAQMSLIRKLAPLIRKILYYSIPKTYNNLSTLSKLKEALRVSLMPKEEFYGNIGGSSLYKPKIYQQRSKQKMSELLDACGGNIIQATIDFDLFYNTLGDNFLVKTDRASMAQPIEIRSPFLDIRRIQRSRKVPTKRKTNRKQTKILMREIIKDIVPRSIITRGKKGFEPPIRDWILSDNYKQEIQKGYKQLVQQGVISREWQTFYDKDVFQKDNKIYRIYMVRLYLFITWYQQWISNLK